MMLATQVEIAVVERLIRTIPLDHLEHYVATVIMREWNLYTDIEIVGLLDDPYLTTTGMLIGQCCPEDETPYLYRIDMSKARLVDLSRVEVQS